MNVRERAKQTINKMSLTSNGFPLDDMALNFLEAHKLLFTEAIEQALIQAEEEVTKREREAFLQIVKAEEEYGERNKINEYACCARAIKGKIKARSEGEKGKGE